MLSQIRPAVVSFAALTLVTGVLYPAAVTIVAKVAFADKAEGSIITRDGHPIGSSLIGQNFADTSYFWPRPSSAGANGYDAVSGSGSNLGPSNPALHEAIAARVKAVKAAHPDRASQPVPTDLVTASGSGLDPHLSPEAIDYQVERVAHARGLNPSDLRRIVTAHTEQRTFGVLGEPRVNVVELNLALDQPNPVPKSQRHAEAPLGWRWRGFVTNTQ